MSKKNPECPLAIPRNCPEFKNARVCALARQDKKCTRRFGSSRPRVQVGIGPGHRPYQTPRPLRNIETTAQKGSGADFYYRRRI